MKTEKLFGIIGELREIADKQVQIRTNKIKLSLDELTTEIERLKEVASNQEADSNKLSKFIENLKVKEKLTMDEAIDLFSTGVEAGKQNQYLKRRQTMYDLKISKMEAEIKELKR